MSEQLDWIILLFTHLYCKKKKLVSALVIQFSMLLGYLYNSGSGFLTAAVDVAICCYCMVDFTISTFVSHVRGKKTWGWGKDDYIVILEWIIPWKHYFHNVSKSIIHQWS